ncbi:MAG: sigma-70 family RNA polymerase sigma factor [Bacilli bacterium]|nr:sigma-70 family RNA polymerase sigma factor [Bacilli bacterium]
MLELQEKLVYSIISKYANNSNREDLFQVGMLGAITAYNKYDKSLGVKYSTFAYKYILGEVLKYLREDRSIHISRDIINDYKKILIGRDYIYKEYGYVDNKKLSKILGIEEERINEVLNYNETTISINKPIGEDITLEDTIKDNKLDLNELVSLKEALNNLDQKEKKLIYERYYNDLTQTEIAKRDNISQVKVYRLERKILDKLKDKMT